MDTVKGCLMHWTKVIYGKVRISVLAFKGSHAAQNIEKHAFSPPSGCYLVSRKFSKNHFIKSYPINPSDFGERLRKARMDAGLQIKDLARMLGVTEETVINWELRGMKPRGRKFEEVRVFSSNHTELIWREAM